MPRLYQGYPLALVFKCAPRHSYLVTVLCRSSTTLIVRENAMRSEFEHHALMTLGEKLRFTDDVTLELMAGILDITCRRAPLLPRAKVLQLEQQLDAGAWTDAALALTELELPLWHIRRIVYDGGEWHCALSRQRELPDWLDQSIEARHAHLALAIVIAMIEAQLITASSSNSSVPETLSNSDADYIPLCCDNFA
jgi:hypothetical protein